MVEQEYVDKLVPSFEIRDRINRLKTEMEKDGFDAAMIVYRPDYHYFSGTSQNSILYIPPDGEPVLFVRRDIDRAKDESPIPNIYFCRSPKQLPDLLREYSGKIPKIIGLELDVFPTQDFFRFKKAFGNTEFVNSSPAIMRCRMKKTAFEIGQIKKAGEITRETFEKAKGFLKPGISEIEFGSYLEFEAKKRGHEGLVRLRGLNTEAYSWHVLSGPNGSLVSEADTPSGGRGLSPAFPMGAGRRKIQSNEPILVDFVVCHNGYLADQTRMFCIGELPQKFLKAYEFCREVELRTLESARPGVDCEALFLLGQRMAKNHGYEDGYLGLPEKKAVFIGHGVGLEANELPVFGLGQNYPLEAGVVVAIEPKVLFPREGIIGIENMFLITDERNEKLTSVVDNIFQV